ncbi:MAG: nitrilase family protein, partial [Bacteroidetes bacterium]|nr:nitrilase family protein [Bacteroidota bacterium]
MTNDKLTVTLIQSALHWEDIDANLAMFEEKIWQIDQKTDLIVLPEMFTTGFTMNTARLAEPMNSKSFKWMKQQAAQTKAVIVGSIIIKEG